MPKAVIMPKFGFTQETATIVRWIVREGEQVEQGDPLAEVTTDKINMEVEAPVAGVLGNLRFPEGAEVPVTEVIAYIYAPGESLEAAPAVSSPAPETGAPEMSGSGSRAHEASPATPVARRMAEVEGIDLGGLRGSGPGGRVTRRDVAGFLQGQAPASGKVRATPAARRIAREQGIDLHRISGSGLEGRVQGSDVLAFSESRAASSHTAPPQELPAAPATAPVQPAFPQSAEGPLVIPLEGVRRTIAQRLQASAQQSPHIYLTLDIEMSRAERMRAALNARGAAGGQQISMTAVILKAVAAALIEHPQLNSTLQDDQMRLFSDVNIGMAVALEDGLIVPVIQKANQKSLAQIGAEVSELSRRAREGRLRPEDIMDGTFTVSNLGMFGIDHFTAIINPPQVAILAVGRIARRFVPGEDDRPIARSLMTVTLSCDHRAVDGVQGARFLNTLKGILETAGAQWG